MQKQLILYSKPGCHLCEGLLEKLEQIAEPEWTLEIRDITSREDWLNIYEYEIPVLCQKLPSGEKPLPRVSPRASVKQVQQMLDRNLS